MSEKAVATARVFLNARLFEGGVDTKGKDATTLWLSRKAFTDLKAKGRLRLAIDSVDCWVSVEGNGAITVEANRVPVRLPVIHVKDERGAERWFLDSEENPLMVRHVLRQYDQTLASITTDRPNTLRWIKGRKLTGPR
jgi:PAS domain-containing protein